MSSPTYACGLQNPLSSKVTSLEVSLNQSSSLCKEIIQELEKLCTESRNYKTELTVLREKCESKSCSGSEVLKTVIETKDNIIQLVGSAATKLNETKNFMYLNDIFKIICGEISTLTSPKESKETIKIDKKNEIKTSTKSSRDKKKVLSRDKEAEIVLKSINQSQFLISNKETEEDLSCDKELQEPMSPKEKDLEVKRLSTSAEDISFKEESFSEIEGTPGRTSPVLQPKSRNNTVTNTGLKNKRICPDSRSPKAKTMKLTYSMKHRGSTRLRQSRLDLIKCRETSIVDLTCSPEESRHSRDVKLLIKKESSENDDTILPSPTSGSGIYPLFGVTVKENQQKFKKPLSLTRPKTELSSPSKQGVENKHNAQTIEVESSIHLLNSNKFVTTPKKSSPRQMSPVTDEDMTHCDSSMSLLRQPVKAERKTSPIQGYSPSKRPLAENKNTTNVMETESSLSLLRQEAVNNIYPEENVLQIKTKTPEKVEPVYKEPVVRKKAEKRALPGWVCEECKGFLNELYADNDDMIAKITDRCSRHRGRNNPARPKTPPGFWDPRWDVPLDTEEFNRRNNAV